MNKIGIYLTSLVRLLIVTILSLTVTLADDQSYFVLVSLAPTVMAESPSHSQPREETEDSEPSILDSGLQPDPFQPGSGLVVASIPPPHLSSETASPAPGSEIAPALPPPRIMADPDAPPLPPRQGTFV